MAYTVIDDPSAHHQTDLYTGTGSTLSITNDGNSDLQPDLIWIKNRSDGDNHMIYDSSRGATKRVIPNTTGAEATDTNGVTSFNSDGATMGDKGAINTSSELFVAWQWKANGGTTTTNDASSTGVGTIDSVYQANTTSGFSIVTYTGTGSNGTIAHGLGVAPTFIMVKNRSETSVSGTDQSWVVYHSASTMGQGAGMLLNTTDSKMNHSAWWNSTAPTSTLFSVGTDSRTNNSGDNFVAYCFADIQGYSKFDLYRGNGDSFGPFVYTGFTPAWVLVKRTDGGTNNWPMWDNKRGVNGSKKELYANLSNAEATDSAIDILSNGFKLRNSSTEWNDGSYIYAAFAEKPFVSSEGVPCTAK